MYSSQKPNDASLKNRGIATFENHYISNDDKHVAWKSKSRMYNEQMLDKKYVSISEDATEIKETTVHSQTNYGLAMRYHVF